MTVHGDVGHPHMDHVKRLHQLANHLRAAPSTERRTQTLSGSHS